MGFPSEDGGITANKIVVTAEEDHLLIDNERATLRELIKAYWGDSCDAIITNNSTGSRVQDLLDTAIMDFPPSTSTPDVTDYTIELCKEGNSTNKTTKKICIQLASNYRGFICDVDLEVRGDKVHVSTETSNFVFPCDTTLRNIAKTCWHESKPLLFLNELPAPTSAQELLDVPVAELSDVQDQIMLEIYEKGNILYKD